MAMVIFDFEFERKYPYLLESGQRLLRHRLPYSLERFLVCRIYVRKIGKPRMAAAAAIAKMTFNMDNI